MWKGTLPFIEEFWCNSHNAEYYCGSVMMPRVVVIMTNSVFVLSDFHKDGNFKIMDFAYS